MKRREFVKLTVAGAAALPFAGCDSTTPPDDPPRTIKSALFQITKIIEGPCPSSNHNNGIDALVKLMGLHSLMFYRSSSTGMNYGPAGLIARDDVVLVKVNAQWKYNGCTNCDLVQGLIQCILEHPDGFEGEVVVIDNGQGRGSLACDTSEAYGGNTDVYANAFDPSHSFLWVVDNFANPRVSAYLLDPIRANFIGADEHAVDGYRLFENVSYPCFTTAGGRRVELKEGIWNGASHSRNLKLINFPVLKHHDVGGSEFTGALKNMYGLVSMSDGQSGFRHFGGLGETCGKMMVSVHTPILNILDCTYVSHLSLDGYPPENSFWAAKLAASQDPVALDYWAAKNILYPIDSNQRHHPDFAGISAWLSAARATIIERGGLADASRGIVADEPTLTESEMLVASSSPSSG